jgi:hypothetical protein
MVWADDDDETDGNDCRVAEDAGAGYALSADTKSVGSDWAAVLRMT